MIKADLYQEVVESFLHLCHIRTYPAKTIIIRPGDVGDKLIFIVEGSVAVSVEDENGHELILAYLLVKWGYSKHR